MHLIDHIQHQKLLAAFHAGLSIRASAIYADVAKNTALRYFNQQPPMLCPCGKQLPHRSWCTYRVAMSDKRQEFLHSRFARGGLKANTFRLLDSLRSEVMRSLAGGAPLAIVDHIAVSELRKFYDPSRPYGLEYNPNGQNGAEICIVPTVEPEQENIPFGLYAALEKLHPAVQKMVLAMADGASINESARESGISSDALHRVLPPLKIFLAQHLK